MALRYCRICSDFHDLDMPWPEACYGHFGSKSQRSGIQIIKDIDPYKAVAVDARTGKAPRIGSRREHREFLKANRYVEVGNEPIQKPQEYEVQDSRREIQRTIHQMKESGRWK